MLDLADPLWTRLTCAFSETDVPGVLAELARAWDGEIANHLFWDCLCHQGTCYSATYAAAPHLLAMAGPSFRGHAHQVEIGLFLGYVALCAHRPDPDSKDETDNSSLNGLPETLDATGGGREEMRRIRSEFIACRPAIRALCERIYLKDPANTDLARHALSGVAAADGLHDAGRALDSGFGGALSCASCGWTYDYQIIDMLMPVYAWPQSGAVPFARIGEDRSLLDLQEGQAVRADAFVTPTADGAPGTDPRAAALLELAKRSPDSGLMVLLRHSFGSMACVKCGETAPVKFS